MERYILCIDNGLTTTKSVIFTLDGREIAVAVKNTIVENRDVFAEIDMELQWKNTAATIKEAIAKSGIDPSNIVGIGNSGHGAGLYCLDKNNKPVRRAVSSMDARAIGIIEEWNRQGKKSYGRLYQNFWSGQAVPILYWLKCHEPENYRKIENILMVKDWIIFNLTGKIGIEYTDASNSGLINPVTKQTDKEILDMFDVGEIYHKIPEIRKTTDVSGYVTSAASRETGLKEGTPMMSGIYDVIACALGSGVYDGDKYSIIAGTWNVNSGIEEKLVHMSETVKCSLFADIDRYLYVESSATSAVNFEWFVENVIKVLDPNLTNKQIFGIVDSEVGKIKHEDTNIIYMPFLYKSHLSRNLDACFWGIKPEHNVYNLIRAIFEGVAFAHKKHVDNLKKGGVIRNIAVLSGGASNSDLWCQMFADILSMEVVNTNTSQVGALGTAVCTAVATGEYNGFRDAIDKMVKIRKHYYPDAEKHEIYMKKYKEFERIISKFDEE